MSYYEDVAAVQSPGRAGTTTAQEGRKVNKWLMASLLTLTLLAFYWWPYVLYARAQWGW